MANFLGYECPKCTSMDEIEVAGTIWLRLTADGTDADLADNHHDHEYQSDSQAVCQACGFQGKFGEFEPPKQDPDLLEALQQALTALNTAPRFNGRDDCCSTAYGGDDSPGNGPPQYGRFVSPLLLIPCRVLVPQPGLSLPS